jgi:hypothetical protein
MAARHEPGRPLPLPELPAAIRAALGVPELRLALDDRAHVGHGQCDLPQLWLVDAAADLTDLGYSRVRVVKFSLIVMVGLLAGTSLSFGQGSSTAVVNGCAKAKTGALRVLKSGQRCRRGERKLTWNRRGPSGSAGATGAAGAGGPAGPPSSFSFDDFNGMPCQRSGGDGTTDLSYDSEGFASFQC